MTEDILNLCLLPFGQMIPYTTVWHQELRTYRVTGISEVIFSSGYCKVSCVSIVVDRCVGHRPFPLTEDVHKFKGEITTDKAILRVKAFSVAGHLPLGRRGSAGNVCSVDCTDSVFEEGVYSRIVGNVGRSGIISTW